MASLPDPVVRPLSHGRLHLCGERAASVLFVHGGFHGAWCWSPVMDRLAHNGISSAAIDLRGHGGLPQAPDFPDQGLKAMGEDMIEALNAIGPDVVVVGHSLGALLALQAATRVSLRGLMLLAPALPAGLPSAHALPKFPEGRSVQPPPPARARKWFMSGATGADMDSYLARLCPESARLLNDSFHGEAQIAPASITCPRIILSGARDDSPLHPQGQDQTLAAYLGAELSVVRASGHCMMLDDGRQETTKIIYDWINAR